VFIQFIIRPTLGVSSPPGCISAQRAARSVLQHHVQKPSNFPTRSFPTVGLVGRFAIDEESPFELSKNDVVKHVSWHRK